VNLTPQLKARVLAAARAESSPTQAQTVRRNVLLLGTAVAVSVGLFLLAGGPRLSPRPPALIAATATGTLMLALGVVWICVARGRSMLGRPIGALWAAALAAPALLLLWKYGISAQFDMVEQWPARPGLRCLRLSLALGVLPLLATLVARKRSDPARPATTGAGFGLAVGMAAAVLMDLWCPVAYVPHFLLGHVLPVVLLLAAGTFLGAHLLGVRAAR
jgi:hypothetical protein